MKDENKLPPRRKRAVVTFAIAISIPVLTEAVLAVIKIVAAVVREWHRGLGG
jgi:hypothetical protein